MLLKAISHKARRRAESGFSLLQLSVLLAVSGAMLAAYLPGKDAGDFNEKTLANIEKLDKVHAAMQAFAAANGYLPCPADGQYDVNNQLFGRAAGAATPNNPVATCGGGSPVAPMGPDSGTGHVYMGTIPTKTLGIPDDYAYDAWGRRFSYVMDGRVSDNATCYAMSRDSTDGDVIIQYKDTTGAVVDTVRSYYAFITHGQDGHGAWPPQGSTVAGRINRNNSNADTLTNAGVDGSFTYTPLIFTNTKVKRDRNTTFDDLVYFHRDTRKVCCIGTSCQLFNPKSFSIGGEASNDFSGSKVLNFDINNDGIDDIVVSAPNADPGGRIDAGAVYVTFGVNDAILAPIDVTLLNGSNGFAIIGAQADDHIGSDLASGDINGDGVVDLVIAAPNAPNGADRGRAYVIFGGSGAWPASMDVSSLAGSTGVNGTNGIIIQYSPSNDKAATSVSTGDVNDDDVDDVIIGIPLGNSADGRTCVVFGKTTTWTGFTPLELSTVNGTNGTCFHGPPGDAENVGDKTIACDINDDGVRDIVMAAPEATIMGQPSTGRVWVRYGSAGLTFASETLSVLTSVTGVKYNGVFAGHKTGKALACGDVTGRGRDSLIIGAPNADANGANSGSVYVAYGVVTPTASIDLIDLRYYNDDGGFRMDGEPGDKLGTSVESGDVGTGTDALIMGAPEASPAGRVEAGKVMIYYGTNTGMLSVNNAETAITPEKGRKIIGADPGDHAGASISLGNTSRTRVKAVNVGAPAATVGGNPGAGKTFNIQKLDQAVYDLSTIP